MSARMNNKLLPWDLLQQALADVPSRYSLYFVSVRKTATGAVKVKGKFERLALAAPNKWVKYPRNDCEKGDLPTMPYFILSVPKLFAQAGTSVTLCTTSQRQHHYNISSA